MLYEVITGVLENFASLHLDKELVAHGLALLVGIGRSAAVDGEQIAQGAVGLDHDVDDARGFVITSYSIHYTKLYEISAYAAEGKAVTYDVNGKSYEGYFVEAKKGAPFVLLIHDWDGLTEYEVKRANMLGAKGYSVFAADLFGVGVRPAERNNFV